MTFECTNDMCDQPSVEKNDKGVISRGAEPWAIYLMTEVEGKVFNKPVYGWYCSVCGKANLVDEKGIEIPHNRSDDK